MIKMKGKAQVVTIVDSMLLIKDVGFWMKDK